MVEYYLMRAEQQAQREAVAQYFKAEAERYKKGETDSLPSYNELADRFGYSLGGIRAVVRKTGLKTVRKEAETNRELPPFSPSSELAWFIGFSAGVKYNANTLSISEKSPEVRERYKQGIRDVFQKEPEETTRQTTSSKQPFTEVYVTDKDTIIKLGDLSALNFATTFTTRYKWIEDPEFVWDFLSGLLDKRGGVSSQRIAFFMSELSFSNTIVDLLKKAGVKTPNPDNPEKMNGELTVTNRPDLRLMAAHLYSADPSKQDMLTGIADSPKLRTETTAEDLTQELARISHLLGNPVRLERIVNLKRQNATLYPLVTYTRIFGGGDRQKTREALTALLNPNVQPPPISEDAKDTSPVEREIKGHGRAHHWRIKSPDGPLSEGTCTGCGITKMFRNSNKEYEFNKASRGK